MADSSIIANEQNEIMWFFLDPEMPTGKLSIIALKQGTTTPTPVLFQKETSKQTWTTSNTVDTSIKEFPLVMSLPSSGLWVLNTYVNERYYDQFVINAEESDKTETLPYNNVISTSRTSIGGLSLFSYT